MINNDIFQNQLKALLHPQEPVLHIHNPERLSIFHRLGLCAAFLGSLLAGMILGSVALAFIGPVIVAGLYFAMSHMFTTGSPVIITDRRVLSHCHENTFLRNYNIFTLTAQTKMNYDPVMRQMVLVNPPTGINLKRPDETDTIFIPEIGDPEEIMSLLEKLISKQKRDGANS